MHDRPPRNSEERIEYMLSLMPRLTHVRKQIVRECYNRNGAPSNLIRLIRQDYKVEKAVLSFYREHARGQNLGGINVNQVTLAQATVPLGINTVKEIALSCIMGDVRYAEYERRR